MKKLLILIPLILAFSFTASSKDESAAGISPITSFLPSINQKLLYTTAQVVSGTPAEVKEVVTIKSLTPKLIVVVEDKFQGKTLAKKEVAWTALDATLFKELMKRFSPAIEKLVISGKEISYISITLQGRIYWFASDGRKQLFPGIIKIAQKHEDHEHIELILTEIIDPQREENE